MYKEYTLVTLDIDKSGVNLIKRYNIDVRAYIGYDPDPHRSN